MLYGATSSNSVSATDTSTLKPKYTIENFPTKAVDDSGVTSGAANDVTFTGGEWHDPNTNYYLYDTDGGLYLTNEGSHRRLYGYVANFDTVIVEADVQKNDTTNQYLMAGAEGSTIGAADADDYYLAGYGYSSSAGANEGWRIWKCVGGSFTQIAFIADTSWTNGETKHLEMHYSKVPGGVTGGNGAKTAIGLYADGELVIEAIITSGLPASGKRCGIWIDKYNVNPDTTSPRFYNWTVKEPTKMSVVVVADSWGTDASAGASAAGNTFINRAVAFLGYDLDNYAVGAATIAEAQFDQLEAFLATGPVASDNHILFINIGVNDLDRGATLPQMMNDLKRLVQRARSSGIFRGICANTLPPLRDITDPQTAFCRAFSEQLAVRYKEIGLDAVSLAALDHRLNGDGTYNGVPSHAGNLATSSSTDDGLFTDELHMNNYGHRIMTGYVVSAIYSAGGR